MNPVPSGRAAHARYILARAWHSKGNLAAAIQGYREALEIDPAHTETSVLLGSLLKSQQRMDEAQAVFREGLERNPNDSRLHKEFVNLTLLEDGPAAVFHHYQLVRKDSKHLNLGTMDILCCVVLRNEISRLPYLFEYYRGKGIRTFFTVDNGSSDGSFEYLLGQPDVYVWQSGLSFNRANFGAAWFEPILRIHGQNHWCLIVDADELLYYPDCESRSIPELCGNLDSKGKRAFNTVHLDMYSALPIRDAHYTPGLRFEEVCPYFDRQFYHRRDDSASPFHNQNAYYGGVRQRVFGGAGYYLSKVPLIKYDDTCILAGGQHWTNLPAGQIADESGCLLHFKYFSSFCRQAPEEAHRGEHYGGAVLYREYARGIEEQRSLSFYDSQHSVKLEDSRQLVRLGVMADEGTGASSEIDFPGIEPVASADQRPFWSVILTVYRRTAYLGQALRSVLSQAPGPNEMQIEVVSDSADDSVQSEIEAIIRESGGGRVSCYRSPHHAGHPEIFNLALRRARGFWVHLLHDDDWVAPGFYGALSKGVLQAPEIGAAFCRHTIVDESGYRLQLSFLERETPGVIENWLDRIACSCRLAPPSIVVRREAYERLGGYCPQARSAFDWEMWQRLAVHYPVWYESTPLAFFRKSSESESAGLIATGEQIAHSRGVIQIAQTYLPAEKMVVLSRRAGENYALRALEHARVHLDSGDAVAALANIKEGVRCSQSDEVKNKLLSLLMSTQS